VCINNKRNSLFKVQHCPPLPGYRHTHTHRFAGGQHAKLRQQHKELKGGQSRSTLMRKVRGVK
jgi:hypothetical protein